jgi:RimJ/RimL family protein N-acetyltransferase
MSNSFPLRPLRASDLATLERALNDPEVLGEHAWTGWSGSETLLRQRWEEDRLLSPGKGQMPLTDFGMLAIMQDETVAGVVTWRPVAYNAVSYCWNAGIFLLPEQRGNNISVEAGRATVEYLFSHTLVHRIEVHVETGNAAARRCTEQLGFTHEGTARGAMWRGGKWRDVELYSLLRTDLSVQTETGI